LKAKPLWKLFEEKIESDALAKGHAVIRIPEKVVGLWSRKKPAQVKTCFDFSLSWNGIAIYFDAKHTIKSTLNIKDNIVGRAEDKIHQFTSLRGASQKSTIAGYLIGYSTLGLVTWCPIEVMWKLICDDVKSVSPSTNGVTSHEYDVLIDWGVLCKEDLQQSILNMRSLI